MGHALAALSLPYRGLPRTFPLARKGRSARGPGPQAEQGAYAERHSRGWQACEIASKRCIT